MWVYLLLFQNVISYLLLFQNVIFTYYYFKMWFYLLLLFQNVVFTYTESVQTLQNSNAQRTALDWSNTRFEGSFE